MKVLLVDIGNSRIKARITDLDDESAGAESLGRSGATHVVDVDEGERIVRELAVGSGTVAAAYVSNVSEPARAEIVARAVTSRWPCARIEHVRARPEQCGVVNGYRDPSMLGSDRWLAVVGAHRLHPARSLLVCSFGTATTIDLLTAEPGPANGCATFVGGLILPGFDAMRRVLAASTARLPLASGRPVDFADRTDDAIASGVMASQAGAVERALRKAQRRLDPAASRPPILCIATGGNAAIVAGALDDLDGAVTVIPDLVLHGLLTVASDASRNTMPVAERTAPA